MKASKWDSCTHLSVSGLLMAARIIVLSAVSSCHSWFENVWFLATTSRNHQQMSGRLSL